jgi:ABC-type multidrug transport system fused ATPase/permease subunit
MPIRVEQANVCGVTNDIWHDPKNLMRMNTFRKAFALLDRSQRTSAVVLVILMVIGVMLETLGVGLVIPALAIMLQGDIGARYPQLQTILNSLGNPTQSQLLLGAMLSLFAIYGVKNVYLAFLLWRQTRFANRFQTGLSERLFTLYLSQPYAFHLTKNSAKLISNITTEAGNCGLVLDNAMGAATETMVLLSIATLLLAVEPLGTLITVAALGGAAWIFYYVTRFRISRWGQARQTHGTLSAQHLQQGLGGVKEVKLMGREDEFVGQFTRNHKEYARVVGWHSVVHQLPRFWLELLAVAGLVILVETMATNARDLSDIVPTVGLFAAAAFRLLPSVNRILSATQVLRFHLPAIDTVYNELRLSPPSQTSQESGRSCKFEQELCFHRVSFRYAQASSLALEDISLSIERGKSIGLIGSSGSGKSTAIDLLLGLLTPTAGEITVDGQNIQTCLRGWQDLVGYVPQSIYLTDDTLRRNVAFGLTDDRIDDEAVKRAIHSAQLEEFVASLPDQIETVVGERGVRLSGGQRQRIGIARALYHNPSILVLDEATSALDTATESGVMDAITALRGTKTIFIVAHRLSTVERCDRLYRLENGRVAQEGPPRDFGIGQMPTSTAG